MKAEIISDHLTGKMVEVKIANDPFTTWVEHDRLKWSSCPHHQENRSTTMPTATAPNAKELRRQAKALGIKGWEEMDRDELAEAIEAAAEDEDAETDEVEDDAEVEDDEDDEDEAPAPRKSTAKKAPAKKATAAKSTAKASKAPAKKAATGRPAAAKKAATPAKKAPARPAAEADEDAEEGPNPFRAGSNLYYMVEELMKGGKRSKMVTRLQRKIDLKPRVRAGKDYDVAAEIDYRLVRVCQLLTNEHGFTIEKDGRGPDQTVQAIPPEG